MEAFGVGRNVKERKDFVYQEMLPEDDPAVIFGIPMV